MEVVLLTFEKEHWLRVNSWVCVVNIDFFPPSRACCPCSTWHPQIYMPWSTTWALQHGYPSVLPLCPSCTCAGSDLICLALLRCRSSGLSSTPLLPSTWSFCLSMPVLQKLVCVAKEYDEFKRKSHSTVHPSCIFFQCFTHAGWWHSWLMDRR